MDWTNIGLRIVFMVCCMTALSVAALGQPQAVAPERAEFDAFYDKVTKAEAELLPEDLAFIP
jgi:hypothetical protein